MNTYLATEISYKNGYKNGVEDAIKQFIKEFNDSCREYSVKYISDDCIKLDSIEDIAKVVSNKLLNT